MSSLYIKSRAFDNNYPMPSIYTCDGANINPPLEIDGVSKNPKSLALIVEDRDSVIGIYDHWIKWNIPPETVSIAEGIEPVGVSGKGSGGSLKYEGPCPTKGAHRFFQNLRTGLRP